MKRLSFYKTLIYLGVAIIMATLSSCFTGIESTSKVKLSRADKKIVEPSAEQTFFSVIRPDTLKNWKPGKAFIVTDSKISFLLRQYGNSRQNSFDADTLKFHSIQSIPSPSGQAVASLIFDDGNSLWEYNTRISPQDAKNEIVSTDLPLLIDSQVIASVKSLLKDRTLYVLTSEWFTDNLQRIAAIKYIPIKILTVEAGNSQFPLKLIFNTVGKFQDAPATASLLMNLGLRATDSRPFHSLFSLTDPREKYRSISDEYWNLIRQGKVCAGMTKQECRLSLGAPAQSQEGHDYNKTLDIWNYGDGKYLRFEDGILTDFR